MGDNACTDGQCTMQCILCLHVLIHEFSASPSIMVIHVLGWMPFLMRVWSVVIKSGEKQSVPVRVLCARLGGVLGKTCFCSAGVRKGAC